MKINHYKSNIVIRNIIRNNSKKINDIPMFGNVFLNSTFHYAVKLDTIFAMNLDRICKKHNIAYDATKNYSCEYYETILYLVLKRNKKI